jgi:hypothetical protein
MIDTMPQDLRYALRTLSKSPGLSTRIDPVLALRAEG